MRQKTKNYRIRGSNAKKIFILFYFPSHIPIWVWFVQKTRAKNSHAWAPLMQFETTESDLLQVRFEFIFWIELGWKKIVKMTKLFLLSLELFPPPLIPMPARIAIMATSFPTLLALSYLSQVLNGLRDFNIFYSIFSLVYIWSKFTQPISCILRWRYL